jgi:hypothetical protein
MVRISLINHLNAHDESEPNRVDGTTNHSQMSVPVPFPSRASDISIGHEGLDAVSRNRSLSSTSLPQCALSVSSASSQPSLKSDLGNHQDCRVTPPPHRHSSSLASLMMPHANSPRTIIRALTEQHEEEKERRVTSEHSPYLPPLPLRQNSPTLSDSSQPFEAVSPNRDQVESMAALTPPPMPDSVVLSPLASSPETDTELAFMRSIARLFIRIARSKSTGVEWLQALNLPFISAPKLSREFVRGNREMQLKSLTSAHLTKFQHLYDSEMGELCGDDWCDQQGVVRSRSLREYANNVTLTIRLRYITGESMELQSHLHRTVLPQPRSSLLCLT